MSVSLLGRCDSENLPSMLACEVPLFLSRVPAGFPSPAQDYVEQTLDLNELCIARPAATFFVRVEGESMIDTGIYPDDILVVDRSIQAKHGDIIIASLHGEMTVKTLELRPVVRLVPANKYFQPVVITEEMEFDVFGVVTNVVRTVRRG